MATLKHLKAHDIEALSELLMRSKIDKQTTFHLGLDKLQRDFELSEFPRPSGRSFISTNRLINEMKIMMSSIKKVDDSVNSFNHVINVSNPTEIQVRQSSP